MMPNIKPKQKKKKKEWKKRDKIREYKITLYGEIDDDLIHNTATIPF